MTTVVANGFFIGLVYALLGVGLVVVYRGTRVLNFAYGEVGMVAAFVFVDLWMGDGVALFIALPAGLGLAAALGAATEILVARPLRGEPPLVTMVATFGVASFLVVFATRRWGLNPHFVEPLVHGAGVRFAGLTIQPTQLLILAAVVGILAVLAMVDRWTSFGLRLRATAIDPVAAGQIGVNVDLTSVLTWTVGGLLAGMSAILIAPLVAFSVTFMTGLLVRGLAAAMIGGLTSIWGAALAGVALGVGEGVIGYVTPVAGTTEVALAGCIVVLLLIRPTGLVRSGY